MKFKATLLSLSLVAVLLTGCVTPQPGQPAIDPQTIEKSAIILKTTVASAVTLAIDKTGPNARKYAEMGEAVLNTLLVSTNAADYNPKVLQDRLTELPIKELKSPEAKVAVFGALGLYEAFYGDYVRARINGSTNAVIFLTAMRDGVALALASAPDTPPPE
jgi:hypothetical protein